MNLLTKNERLMAFDIALDEITKSDRSGPSPPNDYPTHPPYKKVRMFAFAWHSAEFKRQMYMKFGILDNPAPEKLIIFSFHPSRYILRVEVSNEEDNELF